MGFRPPLPCDLGIPFLVSQTFCKGPQSSAFQLLINSCSSYSANSGSFEEDLDLKREKSTPCLIHWMIKQFFFEYSRGLWGPARRGERAIANLTNQFKSKRMRWLLNELLSYIWSQPGTSGHFINSKGRRVTFFFFSVPLYRAWCTVSSFSCIYVDLSIVTFWCCDFCKPSFRWSG